MTEFTVVIPARYDSTRLPGKPLLDIGGKPMIQHVFERAQESGAANIVIATDDYRVADAVEHFGGTVCMTARDHESGTERLSEVITKLQLDDDAVVVNLQGDEPLMPPRLVQQVAENLALYTEASMSTLAEPIESAAELFDSNAVKVVMDESGYALYFSRAAIPWHRDEFANNKDSLPKGVAYYRHIGLYAYRARFIQEYVSWPACALEQIESLEQLRVLWHGRKIHVAQAAESATGGVDTPADLARVKAILGA